MTRYEIGRRNEYKLMQFLESNGMTVLRTAGSHGPWDLIAYFAGSNLVKPHFIQCGPHNPRKYLGYTNPMTMRCLHVIFKPCGRYMVPYATDINLIGNYKRLEELMRYVCNWSLSWEQWVELKKAEQKIRKMQSGGKIVTNKI